MAIGPNEAQPEFEAERGRQS